jgi:plastocyanin
MGHYAFVNGLLTDDLQASPKRFGPPGAAGRLRAGRIRNGPKRQLMSLANSASRTRRPLAVAATTVALIVLGTLVGLALPQSISQKGREFHPSEITVKRGDTVQIVNDDADLLHHAYVDAPKFSFDSGDQEPGSKASINFSVAGDFDVLCAIHPKMRLVVHVQ